MLWNEYNRRYAMAAVCRPGCNSFYIRVRTSFGMIRNLGLQSYTSGNIMHLALAGTFQVLPDGRLGAPAPISKPAPE